MALDPVTELATLVDALEADGVEYAVCGGLALAIHGHARATRDIDVLVPAALVPRVLAVARGVGFDLSTKKMVFGRRSGQPREVQRVSKLDDATGDVLTLDLVLVNPELEPVWTDRVRVVWGERPLTVVSRDGLVTMKRIAGRLQDLADIAKLEGTEDDADPT